MIWARSLAFFVLAVVWTLVLGVLALPVLALPRRLTQRTARLWTAGLLGLVGAVCGLRWRVVGRDNLPAGPVLVAAKHQSALETLIFHQLLDDPRYIVKEELFRMPLVGWYMRRAGNVAIDRAAKVQALRRVVTDAGRALADGGQVIIFPEGTRVAPGQHRPFQAGIAALYAHAQATVVPVALNSGSFWGRRSLRKLPGTVTLEILPPIVPGLDRQAFLAALRTAIDVATDRLEAEAGAPLAAGARPAASRSGLAET
jgi:1-acyl-sn-glycerol-3-phosphate acyltransferase